MIFRAALSALLLWSSCAQAQVGISSFSGQGRTLISLGQGDLTAAFMNFAHGLAPTLFNGGNPGTLTADNYPKDGTLANTLGGAMPLPTSTGQHILEWTGTGAFTINAGVTVVSKNAGCTVTTPGIHASGLSCRIIYTYDTPISSVSVLYPSGATFSGFTNLIICRAADEAAILAGQIWTPEYIATLKRLNPSALRTMGFLNAGGNNLTNWTKWAYRSQLTSQQWGTYMWFPGLWAGAATGTDSYTLGPAPDTPVSWTDGEAFQASFANAASAPLFVSAIANNGSGVARATTSSTASLSNGQRVLVIQSAITAYNGQWVITVIDGTHFDLQGSTFSSTSTALAATTTININSRGAKFVVSISAGLSNFVVPISANSIGTGVYDSVVDFVWYGNNIGMYNGVPIEAQVQLANVLNIPLWYNIPMFGDLALVTSAVTYLRDNLTPALYLEFSNEIWNVSFAQGLWANQRGLYNGWSASSNAAAYSYIGLRIRQVMGAATTAWSPRASSQLIRLGAVQTFGVISLFDTFEFQGTNLSAFSSADCPQNYATSPCRPIDYMDAIPITDYYQGAQTVGIATATIYGGLTFANIAALIAAGTQFALGDNANVQAALAWMDNDIRQGTLSGSGAQGLGTMKNLAQVIIPPWNTFLLSSYPTKTLIGYEGGLAIVEPQAAWLTSVGDGNAATDSLNIRNLIAAYKNSFYAYMTAIDSQSQFVAFSQARTGAWLAMEGTQFGQFPLLAGNVIPAPAPAFQMFDGISAFNHGQNFNYLLKRDLEGANDNSPMWVNRVA